MILMRSEAGQGQGVVYDGRRKFLARLCGVFLGALGLSAGTPIIGYLIGPLLKARRGSGENWLDLGALTSVPVGQPAEVVYLARRRDGWVRRNEVRRAFVVRAGQDEVTVFSATCSHLNCAVRWDAARSEFLCPCHGGVFDQEGRVIAGPPARGLSQRQAKVERGRVWVLEG